MWSIFKASAGEKVITTCQSIWSVHAIEWIGKCSCHCIFILTFQIRSQVASLPSTRLAMRLPSIGFHFSPSRYHRLMQVAKIFQGEDADHSALVRPWDEADYVGWHYHLARKVYSVSFLSKCLSFFSFYMNLALQFVLPPSHRMWLISFQHGIQEKW